MRLDSGSLVLDKELSDLDLKVLEFSQLLEELEVDYVIVSGYVAILTGRSRGTEDVDFLISPETFDKQKFDEILEEGYWAVDATEKSEVEERMDDDLSIRLAEEGEVIPNFELFYPATSYDRKSLEDKITVNFEAEERKLFISPIELQISYKLYLGSEKDFEDALHLYTVFKDEINDQKLQKTSKQMNVHDKFKRLRET